MCLTDLVCFRSPLRFGVLRDHTGTVQLTWSRSEAASAGQSAAYDSLTHLPLESVVSVQGHVEARPAEMINAAQSSGTVEVRVAGVTIINTCTANLPFSLESADSASSEDVRLRYRFLDLRREWMQQLMRLRSRVLCAARTHLHASSFVEIDTPILFKSTPEGADEFLVPTRHAGRFYALPQSPQQHKQLLMVGGVHNYFQVARCFRDEGSRADRQPEFTQLDMEMAFVRQTDVMAQVERVVSAVLREAGTGETQQQQEERFPLRHMTYEHAMRTYGVDKPDMRFDLHLHEITPLVRAALANEIRCPVFETPLAHPDGCIYSLPVRGLSGLLSRKELDALQRELGLGVLLVRVKDTLKTPAVFQPLFAHAPFHAALTAQMDLRTDDLMLVVASHSHASARDVLGKARLSLARLLVDKRQLAISAQHLHMFWVVDFPLFELTLPSSATSETITLASLELKAMHHPFTAPVEADLPKLRTLIDQLETARTESNLSSIRDVPLTAAQLESLRSIRGANYDLVCNGVEVGGGSIRLHQSALQAQVLQMIGAPLHVFQHLLSALEFGAPPHGGIALGVDRVVGLLGASLQERLQQSGRLPKPTTPQYGLSLPIREVIAFPKTTTGQDLMVDAPSRVPPETLRQYHIQTSSDTPTTIGDAVGNQ